MSKKKQEEAKSQEPTITTVQTNEVIVCQGDWMVSVKTENGNPRLRIVNSFHYSISASFDEWEMIVHLIVRAFKQFNTK